jgi:HSP20 family protein
VRSGFDDIVQFFDEVESLMASFWEFQFPSLAMTWSPATDVFVAGEEVYIVVELPGILRRDLKIAVSPVLVEVSGMRRTPPYFGRGTSFYELEIPHGVFRKRIALPCRIEPRRLKLALKDGLLTLRLPRAKAQPVLEDKKGK